MNPLVWLGTLFLTLLAILAAWQWRRWKRHAQACQQTLRSLAFEVTNAANAARAHCIDFRAANPAPQMPGHLDQIEAALNRLTAAAEKPQLPAS